MIAACLEIFKYPKELQSVQPRSAAVDTIMGYM